MSSVSLGLITGFNGLSGRKAHEYFEIDQRILTIRQHLSEQMAQVCAGVAFTYRFSVDERSKLLGFSRVVWTKVYEHACAWYELQS